MSATLYQDTQGESDPDATYYSYDIMGNVKTLVQHSKMLVAVDNANGDKRIDYEYDLISGKVNNRCQGGSKKVIKDFNIAYSIRIGNK